MDEPWWLRTRKRVYLDFHMPEHGDQAPPGLPRAYQALDPEAIAEAARAAGAEAVVFYARDNQGNAYYPSQLGHQLGDLGGRDVVAEFVDALRARDLRAIAYVQPIRDRRAWEAHPEWRQILVTGEPKVPQPWLQEGKGGHRLVCPLGPAGDQALAELAELMDAYDLDGVWWDRVGDIFGPDKAFPCFCPSCKAGFRAHSGFDIPVTVDRASPEWRSFFRWRADGLLAFQQRAWDTVRERRPDAALISNYAFFGMCLADPVPLSVDWEAISDAGDVAALEMQHMRSYLHMTTHPMLMRALTDRPVEIITWNNGHIGDGFVRSAPGVLVATHSAVTRGHAICLHDTVDHAGGFDPRFFDLARQAFAQVDAIAPDLDQAGRLPYAAVLFSPAACTWHGAGDPAVYVQEFVGLVRQAAGLHAPLETISDRHLNDEGLAPFALLVLPMAACLSDAAVGALGRWVEAGGVLLATHESGRLDEAGRPRAANALEALLGVRVLGRAPQRPRWMRARPDGALAAEWGEHPVAARAAYTRVEALDAEVLADMGEPMPGLDTFVHFIAQPAAWGPDPAVTVRRAGRGAAMFVAPALGGMDLAYGVAELAGPLRAALAMAAPPPVRARAPASVDLIAQTRPGGMLVHLTNLQGEVGRTHRMPGLPAGTLGVSEVLPVHDLAIEVRGAVTEARELIGGAAVSVERRGPVSIVRLSRLDATATLRLDVEQD